MRDEKQYLRENVLGLSFTSLLTDISSESVYAVLPFYIRDLGFGRDIVGLVEGAGELVASIFKYLSGFISARIGRYKLLTLIGYSLSSFSKPFFAVSKTIYSITLVKIIDRIGKGIRTSPRDTLLAASSGRKYRGRAFGLHRAMDTVGATIGPLLAIFLLSYLGYNGVFLFSLIPGLLAVLILWLIVKDVVVERNTGSTDFLKGKKSVLPSVFWLFLVTVIISGLTGFTQAYLLIRSREIGWGKTYSIGFLVFSNTIYALLAYPIGYLSDVKGFKKLYPVVFIMQFTGSLSVVLFNTLWAPILFFALYGVYMALHDTLTRIVTSHIVKPYYRAKAYGYMHGSYGLSALTGYYLLGHIYDVYGYVAAFTYSCIVAIIGFIASIILVIRQRPV